MSKPRHSKTVNQHEQRYTISDFFKMFVGRKDEAGKPSRSQAAELIAGGWAGIGYLMMRPEPVGGRPVARKKAVFTTQSAAEIAEYEAWFQALLAQDYTPGWRYYLAPGKCPMANSEFKSYIVHRAVSFGREVIVEFIPSIVGIEDASAWNEMAKHLSKLMGAENVAQEFAMQADLLARGARIMTFSSVE